MKKIITFIFLAVLTVGLMNCGGNPEKDKVVKFLKRSVEIMKTDEYKQSGNFEDMTNKVLTECNYKSFDEFREALQKYSTDSEVIAMSVEYAEIQGGSQN